MSLGRKNMIEDLMSKYGVTRNDVVAKTVDPTDEKAMEKGLAELDLVIDYRNVNLNVAEKFLNAIGADENEKRAALADIKLYKKEFKADLDKEINAEIEEIRKKTVTEENEAYGRYDQKVKEVIDNQVYGKGLAWEEEEAKKAKPKKEKAATTVETVVDGDAGVEQGDADNDPFDQL